MRRGFGILQALLVIVLVSGILVVAMKYATVSVKQTKDLYIKESAELFMSSAIELTLLAISDYDRSTNCLENIHFISSDKRFEADIEVVKYYLYKDENCGVAKTQYITTEDSHGMVMLEVTVKTTTHAKNNGVDIKLTRRTLQRP
jgi:hypothetical protein